MKTIGIILAMEEELNAIVDMMQDYEEESFRKIKFIKGRINNNKIVLALSGVGKVNAARCTQLLIDLYAPNLIIATGVAGSCVKELKLLDIVVADRLYQHDFDITIFDHKLGYVPLVGDYNSPKEDLINDFIEKSKDKYDLKKGSIASGDQFINTIEKKLEINRIFNAICCEMESASIAQVSKLNDIDFIITRVISDALTNDSSLEYEDYLTKACNVSADVIMNYLSQI